MTTIKAAAEPSEFLALADQQASARKRYHESDAALIRESETIEWALRRAAKPAGNDEVSEAFHDVIGDAVINAATAIRADDTRKAHEILAAGAKEAALSLPREAGERCYPDKERALLAKLVYEAMRFSIWAAGQGIMADLGEPTLDPEDFLFDYSKAMDVDDWEGLAEVARDAIGGAQAGKVHGSGVEMIDNLSSEDLANWRDDGNCNAGRPTQAMPEPLRELVEFWMNETRLQTFEDRQRFRKAARAALAVPSTSSASPERTMVVGRVTGKLHEGDQVPGMPGAICHACGLKDYPCVNPDCPHYAPKVSSTLCATPEGK